MESTAKRARPIRLSPRMHQVLSLTAQGMTGPEIAHELGLRPKTIESIREDMRNALGARNVAHAVTIGFEMGLLHTRRLVR